MAREHTIVIASAAKQSKSQSVEAQNHICATDTSSRTTACPWIASLRSQWRHGVQRFRWIV